MFTHSPLRDCNVGLHAVGTKGGEPGILRYMFDLSRFRDPIGQPILRYQDGRSKSVQEFVQGDKRLPALINEVRILVYDAIKNQDEKYIAIGFCDYHGRLISSAVAEIVADELERDGFVVGVNHHAIN
jgi:RNase adaptor protein for sRNA GlmZ degradation